MKKTNLLFSLLLSLMFSVVGFRVFSQDYILNESFDNNSNGWNVTKSDDAKSYMEDGKYFLDVKSGIFVLNQLKSVYMDENRDWVIETQITKKRGGDLSYGITWGADNLGSRYNFVINSAGNYSISKWTDYNVSFFATSIATSYINGDYTANKLKIKKVGRKLEFYVNDQYLQDVEYEKKFGNYVGFYANMGDIKLEIDYYKVYYSSATVTTQPTNNTTTGKQMILDEDYNNNSNGWNVTKTDDAKSFIEDGKYYLDVKSGIFVLNQLKSVYMDESKDWVIETSMTKKRGGDLSYGITWGADNEGSRYNFVINSAGNYSISKWTNYNVSFFATSVTSSYINGDYTANIIKIKKVGNKLEFYINDHYLQDVDYEKKFGSYVGYYANMGDIKLEIDYYKVYYTGSSTAPTQTNNTSGKNWVFEEDFSNNNNAWYEGSDDDMSAYVEDGRYLFTHKRTESSYYVFKAIQLDEEKDWVMETTIKKVSGVEDYGFGFCWGYKDATNRYDFCVSSNGFYRVGKIYDGDYKDLKEWTTSTSVNKGNGAINTLKIKKVGDDLTFYVNGDYVYTMSHRSFYGTKIGFVVYRNQKISIDNVYVYYPGSATTNNTNSNEDYGDFVSRFLKTYYSDANNSEGAMMAFISPRYISENNLNSPKYKVNSYTIYGHKIESVDNSSGVVIAKIWGENKGWQHRLEFKVVRENGQLYLYPSQVSDYDYIYPWTKATTYVTD